MRSIAREGIQARHPGYDDLQLDRALFRQIYGLNESPPRRVDTRNLAPAVTLPPGTLVRA